jgi:3-deoxy-D-manno-octulosonic-acid transferase
MYAGDTRFDNVWEKHKTNQVANEILAFSKDNREIIIAGSSYKIEEDLLAGVLNNKQNKLIVAPHFISEERIKEIERIFKTFKVTRFSKALTINNLAEYDVLILDNIGNLTSAYAVATIAFIGGGFRKGNLHNILEPSVYGLRICFGPLIDKFPEAQAMIELGLAKIIKNRKDLADFLAEPNHNIKEKIKAFIEHQLGSTEIIIKNIKA